MRIFAVVSRSGGVKQGWGGANKYLLALCIDISKTLRDTTKLLLMTNRKLRICFPWARRSMTLDDLEFLIFYKFNFFLNFALLRIFGRPIHKTVALLPLR